MRPMIKKSMACVCVPTLLTGDLCVFLSMHIYYIFSTWSCFCVGEAGRGGKREGGIFSGLLALQLWVYIYVG